MSVHPEATVFLPMTQALRLRIEVTIEQLIGLLDEIDGDADLERDEDAVPNGDETEEDARDWPA